MANEVTRKIDREETQDVMLRIKDALEAKFSNDNEYPRFRALTDDERRQWTISSVSTLEKKVINDIIATEIIREINHDMFITSLNTAMKLKQLRKFMQRDYARFKKKQAMRLSGGGGGDEVREPYKEPKKSVETSKLSDVMLDFDDLRNFVDRHLAEFKAFEQQAVEDMSDALDEEFDFSAKAKNRGISVSEYRNEIMNILKGDAMISAEQKNEPLMKALTDQLEKSDAIGKERSVQDITDKYNLVSQIRLTGAINQLLYDGVNKNTDGKVSAMLKAMNEPGIQKSLDNKSTEFNSLVGSLQDETKSLTSNSQASQKSTSTNART